ncbi:MAG: hypothetical protein L0226_14810 [Acidobacteria bacterium]|nr:hypothetical protein [Acidobacteriota bacterium]
MALRFVDQFAGVGSLSERIFALRVQDEAGAILPLEIRGDGLYLFNNGSRSRRVTISYDMRLGRPLGPSQYALTSSLGSDGGFLILGDLLPGLCVAEDENCETSSVRLQVLTPAGWKITTTERHNSGFFEIADPQRAVFFLGNLREKRATVKTMVFRMAIVGVWGFSDEEVFRIVEAIAHDQDVIIDSVEAGEFLVTLAPFPLPMTGLRSSAVTIGRTVILQLSTNDNTAQSFAHFRRHLAHEMFHFYLPNSFQIRENFDWFWEGFTRYIALLTLARLRVIGLREYFDAIGAEYEAYAFNPLRARVSLIAASPEKFADKASYDLVYRKGMLVAALYDLELRWQSKGKLCLADVIRGLYQNYAKPILEVGNKEVLSELGKLGDFKRAIHDDIEGTQEIEILERLKPYGLVVESSTATQGKVRISKAAKLTERQRVFLEQLASEK